MIRGAQCVFTIWFDDLMEKFIGTPKSAALETHSSSEISAAIRRVERRDQAADKAPNEPNEGRHPSQQGHVNEYVSDGEQKV
jgi:hypothetical protein